MFPSGDVDALEKSMHRGKSPFSRGALTLLVWHSTIAETFMSRAKVFRTSRNTVCLEAQLPSLISILLVNSGSLLLVTAVCNVASPNSGVPTRITTISCSLTNRLDDLSHHRLKRTPITSPDVQRIFGTAE
jgi:hypothetical protein